MVDGSRPRESKTSATGELQHSVEHSEYGDKYVGFNERQHDGFTPSCVYLRSLYTSNMKSG